MHFRIKFGPTLSHFNPVIQDSRPDRRGECPYLYQRLGGVRLTVLD